MDSDNVPQFRTSKRQKVFRSKRMDDDDDDDEPQTTGSPHRIESDSDGPNVSTKALFRRPAPRKFGIATSKPVSSSSILKQKPGAETNAVNPLDMAAIRFAPQTGLIRDDTDKHMNAYVDARLAQLQGDSADQEEDDDVDDLMNDVPVGSNMPISRQAAGIGKLQEIDLGPDAARMNMLRTQEAAARLNGDMPDEIDETLKPYRKPRLGRDGKPWRGRRKRRTSDDLKRDKMVEAILAESRLDLYENPSSSVLEERDIEEGDADDRLAEEFRREYLDAQQAKRRHPTSNRPARKKEPVEKSKVKGPKLGGSRNARAAMYKATQDTSKGNPS